MNASPRKGLERLTPGTPAYAARVEREEQIKRERQDEAAWDLVITTQRQIDAAVAELRRLCAVVASTQVQRTAKRLLAWSPENKHVHKRGTGFTAGDQDAPFFSETYLYPLLGKDDARTLLALMRPIWEACGIERRQQP